jgi:probable O-glycosylation ligase (exosortase A-associated)
MLYLIIDYARLQDVIPFLGLIEPGLIIIIILTLFSIFKGDILTADTKQTRLIALFILLLMFYVPFVRNNFFAWNTVKMMLLYTPFILSVIFCVGSIDRLKTIIFVMTCIMLYLAVYSLGHGGKGSGGYFSDENDLSLFIDMWLPFCYYLFLVEKDRLKKAVYICGFIIGIISVVVSFSRGGFIGLIAMFVVLWYFNPRKVLTLTVITVCACSIYFFGGQAYRERITTVTDMNEGTADERILSWETAWDMFLDNPLGVGGNNFQVRFPEYQGHRFKKGMWGRVAHSLWFTLIPETGIFGIIIYLMLLYYNIKDIFKIRRLNSLRDNPDAQYLYNLSLAMLASLAGFFAAASFISVLYYPHYWYMTAIIVATMNITKHRSEILVTEAVKSNRVNTITA